MSQERHIFTPAEFDALDAFKSSIVPSGAPHITEGELFPPKGLPFIDETTYNSLRRMFRVDGGFETETTAKGWNNPSIEHPYFTKIRLAENLYEDMGASADDSHVLRKVAEWVDNEFKKEFHNAAASGVAVTILAFTEKIGDQLMPAIHSLKHFELFEEFKKIKIPTDQSSIIHRNNGAPKIPPFQVNLNRLINEIANYTNPNRIEEIAAFKNGARGAYEVLDSLWDTKISPAIEKAK